jgi:pimeloyl-ACP methyl ester carboxylesterase
MKKRYLIAGAGGLAGAVVAAKLLSRPRDLDWTEHVGELHHAERSRFAEIEGVRVHYQEAGAEDAPPIILIHGFTASTLVWSEVLLSIAGRGFHVVAPDLLGFGYSGKPKDGEYTIEAQARMIVGLMDKLGLERATLVGSSYGGAIAATCALDYPSRVKRLVLVGAVSNDAIKKQALLRLGASPLLGDIISPLLLGTRWIVRRRMKRNYAQRGWEFDEKRFETHHRPLRTSNTQRAVLRTLRRWKAERISLEAGRITQPTLLIWGEHDLDVPLSDGYRLHQKISNSRLVVFHNGGHLPQEEFPEDFTKLVTEFVNHES